MFGKHLKMKKKNPVMIGSHIDSVVNAGIYDGCFGVLSGLEVIRTLQESGFKPKKPIVVGAFTNEEGVRYQPDMMGVISLCWWIRRRRGIRHYWN